MMRSVLLAICGVLVAGQVWAAPVRVYKRADNSVAVVHWTGSDRTEPRDLVGLPFVDTDSSQLPSDRTKRNKWRLNGSNQVFVDNAVVDPVEMRQQRRDSAKTKLRALGLTAAEVQALTDD